MKSASLKQKIILLSVVLLVLSSCCDTPDYTYLRTGTGIIAELDSNLVLLRSTGGYYSESTCGFSTSTQRNDKTWTKYTLWNLKTNQKFDLTDGLENSFMLKTRKIEDKIFFFYDHRLTSDVSFGVFDLKTGQYEVIKEYEVGEKLRDNQEVLWGGTLSSIKEDYFTFCMTDDVFREGNKVFLYKYLKVFPDGKVASEEHPFPDLFKYQDYRGTTALNDTLISIYERDIKTYEMFFLYPNGIIKSSEVMLPSLDNNAKYSAHPRVAVRDSFAIFYNYQIDSYESLVYNWRSREFSTLSDEMMENFRKKNTRFELASTENPVIVVDTVSGKRYELPDIEVW